MLQVIAQEAKHCLAPKNADGSCLYLSSYRPAYIGSLTQLLVQLCFGNGRLEEFLLDQTVTALQMQTPPIAVCVAAAMAMFNFTQLTKLPRSERSHPICWGRLRSWAGSMQKLYTKEELAAEHIDNAASLVGLFNAWSSRMT